MNLRDAILTVLSESVWMTSDEVYRGVNDFDWPEVFPKTSEIISCLEALAKERVVIHLLGHSRSIWRKRSDRELQELKAEMNGAQGKLL